MTTTLDIVDPGDNLNSLREAIFYANQTPAADTITLPAGNYALSIGGRNEDLAQTGDLDIRGNLTIIGAGANATFVDAQELDRVLHVVGPATVSISGVTIRNGQTDGNGGGILNEGMLTLTNTNVSDNQAQSGGGVYHTGGLTLEVMQSTISLNHATGSQGAGGGIVNARGNVKILNSSIADNAASLQGGGLLNALGAGNSMRLENSTVAANSAGTGGGGGIFNLKTLFILNSTVSGNTTTGSGGGISSTGDQFLNLTFATIANNVSATGGGGIYDTTAYFQAGDTIIADNTDASDIGPDVFGTCAAHDTLIENVSQTTFRGSATSNLLGVDPRLEILAQNGGPTLTHALKAGSPALNRGFLPAFPATDQRSVLRPQGVAPDLGAFESVEFAALGLRVNDVSVIEGDADQTVVVFSVTLSAPTSAEVQIPFATANGTATAGDYEPTSGVVLFQALETSKTITVQVNGDTDFESSESFFVNLSAPGGVVLEDGQGRATIQDDDARPLIVTGADAGAGPHVRALTREGRERFSFYAFDPAFSGGVRVATGDVTGDGTPDIIAAAGPGAGPHVRVFDGVSGEQVPGAIGSFYAYDPAFTGGVFVASADFNGDGFADILTGPGIGGGPHIRVFSGQDGSELVGFFDDSKGDGGVRVASGDIDCDGTPDIIAAMGPGGVGPGGSPDIVRVFSGLTGQEVRGGAGRILAYSDFRGGVYVASGDVNGDGRDDVVTGAGAGGGPHVRAFSGVDGSELASFFAYNAAFIGGVRVGVGDVDLDGDLEIITGPGPGGGPHVRAFDVLDDGEVASFFAFNPAFTGGVFVAGASLAGAASSGAPLSSSQTAASITFDVGAELSSESNASNVESETALAVLPEVDTNSTRDLIFTGPDALTENWRAEDEVTMLRSSAGNAQSLDFAWSELADLIHASGELV